MGSPARTPFWISLYNHNPFYVISSVLMLISVRLGYGEMPIGEINCWKVMGVLAGYTLVLATVGVLIIRLGKVWDDTRSILLLLVLLFLGVSMSMDDLLVHMDSNAGSKLTLVLAALSFAIVVSEGVLVLSGIKLGLLYRLPYYLFLALFYFAPYVYSPEVYTRPHDEQEWLLFGFPLVAGLLLLTLLPATRLGSNYTKNDGTPWIYPLYPWSLFVMLIVASILRSYFLCLSFGPRGPVWVGSSGSLGSIALQTIWQPYFLLPIALAVVLLLLEGQPKAQRNSLGGLMFWVMPLFLLLGKSYDNTSITGEFLQRFTQTLGSPLWISVWMLVLFYTWSWLRGVTFAKNWILVCLLLFTRITPTSYDIATLGPFQTWPLAILSILLVSYGFKTKSSFLQTAGLCLVILSTTGLWRYVGLEHEAMRISMGLYWATALILGLIHKDAFSEILRGLSSMMTVVLSIAVMEQLLGFNLPMTSLLLMIAAFALATLLIAYQWRSRWFLAAWLLQTCLLCYIGLSQGFYAAGRTFGFAATTAFLWSLAGLSFGILISAHKARWLPNRLLPRRWT